MLWNFSMFKVGDIVKFHRGYAEIIEIDIYDDGTGDKEEIYMIEPVNHPHDSSWRFKEELLRIITICTGIF